MTLKTELGQFFTPDFVAQEMSNLIQNHGSLLEPSCGNGVFLQYLPKTAVAIEIDPDVAPKNAKIMDFFDWDEKMDTIIGNPPYIRFQEIPESTKQKLPPVLDNRANLFLFFIWRAIDLLNNNGELIFIVPRDFIKLTAARQLNERLYNEGGFTFWKEYGDEKIFTGASPNVAIFRWVKGEKHQIPINYNNGYLSFSDKKTGILLSELFDIRVGGASGLNEVFIESSGNIDLVVSTTKKTGNTKKAHYKEQPDEYLFQYKEQLMNRGIKHFTEKNWWEWGRKIRPVLEGDKIYVNCKTRDEHPFFTHSSGWYDGSILALIPKYRWYNSIDEVIEQLNNNNWAEQGFKVGGRLIFGQKSLLNAYLVTNL